MRFLGICTAPRLFDCSFGEKPNKGLQNLMPRALGCSASQNDGRKDLRSTTCVASNSKICKAVQHWVQSFALCPSPSPPAAVSSLAPSRAGLWRTGSPLPLPGDATNPRKWPRHLPAPLKACRALGQAEPPLPQGKSWCNA